MAEHSVTFEVFYDGAWHAAPVLDRDSFRVMRGVKTPGNDTDPAEGGLTLDNASGLWAPKSVLSGLYGKIGQNTPGRASLDGDVRMTGEVASWKPQRPVKGSGYTPIELGGVLRRIGRGTDPLRPSLTRAALASGPVDYWPADDGKFATSAANVVSGGAPLAALPEATVPTFSGFDAALVPAGLAALPAYNSGVLSATVRGTSATSWRMECVFAADPSISGDRRVIQWRTPTGGITDWWVETDNNSTVVSATSTWTNGSTVFAATLDSSGTPAALADGAVHHVALDVSQTNSTTLHYEAYVDGVLTDSGNNVAAVGRPQCGPPTTVIPNPERDSAILTVGAIGFWSPHPSAPIDYAAVGGYAGELAAVRFPRLCAEEGITAVVAGDPDESVAMGPQGTDPLLVQLDEIARTDDASIFETKDALSLTMRTGVSKMNQDIALSVSYLGQVQPPLRPVFGDQGIRNDVTARSPNGSTGRVVQPAGYPHNVELPEDDPHGVGKYSTAVDVNTAEDSQLSYAAGWRVNLGTYDGTWYAAVTVDLDAAPGLLAAVNAVDIGDVVAITELPVEDSVGTFIGIVLGIEDDAPPKRRLVTFYLAAADPYRVGVLAETTGDTDPTIGYAESDGATTHAAILAGATSFTVDIPSGPLWTTIADDFPQDVIVGGQRVTLTSVTGAGSPQTFNVRSAALGGLQVRYPIPANADVFVYQPLIPTQ